MTSLGYWKILFWLGLGLLSFREALTQQIIVNSKGERIVVYPDGSRRSAQPGDSVLVQHIQSGVSTSPSMAQSSDPTLQRNKGEEQEYILRQWNELYSNILAEEKIVQNEFRNATNTKFKADERLQNAEANKGLIEPVQLATLQDEYDQSINHLRSAKQRQKDIEKIVDKATKINSKPSKIKTGKLNQMKSNFNFYLVKYNTRPANQGTQDPAASTSTAVVSAATIPGSQKNSSDPAPKSSGSATTTGLPAHRLPKEYYAAPFQCVFVTDTIDRATGQRRLALESSVVFTHTDPDLRPYFKDKDLMTCIGQISKIGPYVYLTLVFQIASSHSQSNFGSLEGGSLLRLRMMDGEYISLYNLKADRGRIDPYSGYTVFIGQYALGKKEIKKLKAASLDKMRVLWGTGYEDYEVIYIDFLKNQLYCILDKK